MTRKTYSTAPILRKLISVSKMDKIEFFLSVFEMRLLACLGRLKWSLPGFKLVMFLSSQCVWTGAWTPGGWEMLGMISAQVNLLKSCCFQAYKNKIDTTAALWSHFPLSTFKGNHHPEFGVHHSHACFYNPVTYVCIHRHYMVRL